MESGRKRRKEGTYKQSGRKVEECREGEGEFGVNTRGGGLDGIIM